MSAHTTSHIVRFCWACGRKLWGRQGVVKEVDGEFRMLHKGCADYVEYMSTKMTPEQEELDYVSPHDKP